MAYFEVEELWQSGWDGNTYEGVNTGIHFKVFCDKCGSFKTRPGVRWVKTFSHTSTIPSGWLIKTSKQIRTDYYTREALCTNCGTSFIMEPDKVYQEERGGTIEQGATNPREYYLQMRSRAKSLFYQRTGKWYNFFYHEKEISEILSEITNGDLPGRNWEFNEIGKMEQVKV